MRNAGLDETQPGIKTAERNINNLRYANSTTLMAKSKRVLEKHLLLALLTMPKPLTVWITTNCGKF